MTPEKCMQSKINKTLKRCKIVFGSDKSSIFLPKIQLEHPKKIHFKS